MLLPEPSSAPAPGNKAGRGGFQHPETGCRQGWDQEPVCSPGAPTAAAPGDILQARGSRWPQHLCASGSGSQSLQTASPVTLALHVSAPPAPPVPTGSTVTRLWRTVPRRSHRAAEIVLLLNHLARS